MKLSLSWQLLSSLVLAASPAMVGAIKARLAATSPCNCGTAGTEGPAADAWAVFGVTRLLQEDGSEASAKRPRDCTCINGMKTYQTTPREKLERMGTLELNTHLRKCEQKFKGLTDDQLPYAVAEKEVNVKESDAQMKQFDDILGGQKKSMNKDLTEGRKEKDALRNDVDKLAKKVQDLNGKYNSKFTEWFRLNTDLKGLVATTKDCKSCPKNLLQAAKLLQVLLSSGSQPAAAGDEYYRLRPKIEGCEDSVIKVSNQIAEAQSEGRDAQIKSLDNKKFFGKRMADQQRLGKLVEQKPQVDALVDTKKNLEKIVKDREEKLETYGKSVADMQKQVKELKDHMEKCQC